MTQLSKSAFKTTYSDASGTFADNTTREISEGDLRQFAEDAADSFQTTTATVGPLNFEIFEIGDWDMTSTFTFPYDLGAIDYTKIRTIDVIIRNDGDTASFPLDTTDSSWVIGGRFNVSGGATYTNQLNLSSNSAGLFNSTNYDATSYNRGWITIGYED